MANFVMVESGGMPGCYVNLDLVRVIIPDGNRSIVIFDDGHRIGVNQSSGILAAGLMKQVQRAI